MSKQKELIDQLTAQKNILGTVLKEIDENNYGESPELIVALLKGRYEGVKIMIERLENGKI